MPVKLKYLSTYLKSLRSFQRFHLQLLMLWFPSPHNAKSYFEAIWAVDLDHNFLLLFPLNFVTRCSSEGKQHQVKCGHLCPSWYWRLHPYQRGCYNAAQNNVIFLHNVLCMIRQLTYFSWITHKLMPLKKRFTVLVLVWFDGINNDLDIW